MDIPTHQPGRGPDSGRERLTLGGVMVLIVGLALGLAFIAKALPEAWNDSPDDLHVSRWDQAAFVIAIGVLGGLSLVGVPWLLWERRRKRIPWGDGRFFWFSLGSAAWLLWPPVVYFRTVKNPDEMGTSGICYYYGTPLMALYVTLGLLAGGRLGRSRRRRLRRSWKESFGILLGLAWACTGAYVIVMIYRADLRR